MFIINSIAISNDQKYVIGATNNGTIQIWDLESILLENSNRTQEKTQNTLVYKTSFKFQLFNEAITHILLIGELLYCVVGNKLYQIQVATLISQNQIIDTEINASTLIQTFSDSIEFIKYNKQLIVAICSKLYFIDIEHDNSIIEVIDILKSINDCIHTLVPITEVKITCLEVIGQNFLAIGSDIGIIGIWSTSTYTFQSALVFKDKQQELSKVYDIIYAENEQQIISLHKDYMVVWNQIVGNDIEIKPFSDYYKMCQYHNNILLTKGNGQIEILDQKGILQCSSEVILQFSKFQYLDFDILIANGSSPFVDIFVDRNYTLTLSCL